ncbi:MAG TPA: hypothetical protein PLW11_12175 [Bacillota bacterium]|nr:hypothetical protein [Bacillota bacterium]
MNKKVITFMVACLMLFSIISAGDFVFADREQQNDYLSSPLSLSEDNDFEGLNERNYDKPELKLKNEQIQKDKLKKCEKELLKIKNSRSGNTELKNAALVSTTYSVNLPVIKQILGFNCGAATALQTIDSIKNYDNNTKTVPASTKSYWWLKSCCLDGNLSNIATSNWKHPSGSTTHTKCYKSYTDRQITMINKCGTTYEGSTSVGVASGINTYLPSSYYSAIRIAGTTAGKEFLRAYSIYDLKYKYALTYKVKLKYLSHYGSDHTGVHFVSGYSYIDNGGFETDKIGIADCNYSSKGGKYTENFLYIYKGLYNTLNENMTW